MTATVQTTTPQLGADPQNWTIAYRKRTGPVFHRVTNWSGTWAQAREMANAYGELHPELQVWYTTTRAYELAQEAELPKRVAAGEITQELADSYLEDHGNILTDGAWKPSGWTQGKRVKIRDNGYLPDELLDDEINNVAVFMLQFDRRPARGTLDEWRFWARDMRDNHPTTYASALELIDGHPEGTPRGRFNKGAV